MVVKIGWNIQVEKQMILKNIYITDSNFCMNNYSTVIWLGNRAEQED